VVVFFFLFFLLFPIIAVMYFVPAAVALLRRHNNAMPICLLNLLTGWTFLGWVASLVWSLTDNTHL
jgi:hypothetical protein